MERMQIMHSVLINASFFSNVCSRTHTNTQGEVMNPNEKSEKSSKFKNRNNTYIIVKR